MLLKYNELAQKIKGERYNYVVRTDDSASPRAHVNVITIIHSIAHSSISNTFLPTFKLLQQPEIPRYYILL